jgi:UPF0755 protein
MSKIFLRRVFRICLLVAGFGTATLIVAYNSFYGNAIEQESSIYINPETSYDQLCHNIENAIGNSAFKVAAFNLYASHINLHNRYKTGHYYLTKGMSVIRIARNLALGEQTPINLIVGGARTIPQLASKLSQQIAADSAKLVELLYDKKIRASHGYVRDSIMAMFIPNTYEVYWTITPEQLLQRMHREYDAFWNSSRESKRKGLKMSRYEVITLASIVYEETKAVDEMARVAGVYINRLRKGMPLQADPTVKYALQDFGLKRILHKHLRTKSPYNTYVNKGLPPSPICIPSIAAIDAVLDYEKHSYIFFCARPELDGRHNFARTLSEHNANARAYSAALNKLKIK